MRIRIVNATFHSFRPSMPHAAVVALAGDWMSERDRPSLPADSGQGTGAADDEWSILLVAVADGRNRLAFEQLFGFFAPRIKSSMLRMGMAPSAAEEIAQEAMLSVWRKAGLIDPARASAATWIFTIARNLRTDAQRRDGRRREVPEGDAVPDQPDPAPLAEDIALRAERDASVRAALADLPEDQAKIIHLSFFEDKPHAEIARELAIPLGTVKSRVRLAAVRLRKLLGDRL